MTYAEFIAAKMPVAQGFGFEPKSKPHKSLKPHQKDTSWWLNRGGRRACFQAFGLGKSREHLQVAKWSVEETCKKHLIVAPLGVRNTFIEEEGPAMGMKVAYCATDADVKKCKAKYVITNYERVRDGNITIDPEVWGSAGLDEGAVLRSYGSKTFQLFRQIFRVIPYRYIFTATPSPNRYKELIHYADFLGVMDSGEALTRFFKRDSSKANNLTIYPHMEEMFFLWMSSWAVFMQSPADLGYDATGYDLPKVHVHWHCIPTDHAKIWGKQFDSWGQGQLVQDKASGLSDVAEVKRETILARLAFAKELIEKEPKKSWLLWHDLEAERHAIEKAIPGIETAYGSQKIEDKEDVIRRFSKGQLKRMGSKASICGSGTNFQKFCARAIFLGASFKFHDLIQAYHRIVRFQQQKVVHVHFIYSESEENVVKSTQQKWKQHDELVARMVTLLKKYKLSLKPDMQLSRSIGVERAEVTGEKFRVIKNDTIMELMPDAPEAWPDNCVDQIVTSVPFGNQYEYSPSFLDLGHNEDNEAFFKQMEYLVPNLLRVLKPGRTACIHVKDRIRFGNVTGKGVPTVDRFSDKTADLFEKYGFNFMGRITIDTDVVRENSQTYRLGWSENAKDGTKMGCGMPEYVLMLRKPQSDTMKAYADVPVEKSKEDYTRAQWQIDASGFWRSDGNRLPDAESLLHVTHETIGLIWWEHCRKNGYNYRAHVEIGKELEKYGKLPATFMLFPPISKNPDVWTDIARMRTLNSEQSRRNLEHHVAPLQLDCVERLITRFSNRGEVVFDPFLGIGTVAKVAIDMGRKGWGCELSEEYWRTAVGYAEMAEAEQKVPTLFDLGEFTREKPTEGKQEEAVA
jgi:DNA modification methylase